MERLEEKLHKLEQQLSTITSLVLNKYIDTTPFIHQNFIPPDSTALGIYFIELKWSVTEGRYYLNGQFFNTPLSKIEEITNLLVGLLPSAKKLEQKHFNESSIQYGVANASLFLSDSIRKWWYSLEEPEFKYLLKAARSKSLPDCLTSKEEMLRLLNKQQVGLKILLAQKEDIYKTVINRTPTQFLEYNIGLPPARYELLGLYGEIKNLQQVFKKLKESYPNEISLGKT